MRQYTGSEKERHAGGSFTLIELLVVIAIIAILAAMLMPALKQARDHAKSVKCVANQRNCIYGLSNYADAYQEFFPAALSILHVNGAAKNYGWSGILVSSGFLPLPRVSAVDNIFFCPSGPPKNWDEYGSYSYGIIRGNADFGNRSNYTADTYFHVRRTILSRSENRRVPLGGDSIHTRDLYQANSLGFVSPATLQRGVGIGSNRTLHLRHSRQANTFYLDGHVDSLHKEEIVPESWVTYAAALNPGLTTF